MDSVWLLHHVHAFADGSEDVKLIGAFASLHEGEAAQALVATQPGFKENPEGFSLEECRLGIIYWQEGFVTEPAFAVGSSVEIVSVESCAKELPIEDQNRLFSLVGQERRVVEIGGVPPSGVRAEGFGFAVVALQGHHGGRDREVIGELR